MTRYIVICRIMQCAGNMYLDGKQCTRLDKSVPMLLLFIRDLMFERIIKLAKQKPSDRPSIYATATFEP